MRQRKDVMRRDRARGFTLVELLVVITIIGILIALLLPAVQAARAAARRTKCANNFKQVALALHNYHAAVGSLPPGMMFYSSTASCPNTPGGFYNGWGWHVQLLPYVEQQNVFADFDFNVGGSHLPGGREALGNVIDAYICPDDPLGKRWVECCSGYHNGPGPNDDVRATSMAGVADSRSFYCGSYRSGRTDANGVLYNLSATTIADVRDGTSNTLLVGEVTGGQGSHPSYGPATITYHWYNWAIQDVAQGINGPGSVPGGRSDTVDPLDGDGGNRHDELYDEVGFCSFHPGGAHFALCDGSVQFLSENINHSVLEALATRAGREPIPADAF